MGVWGEHSANTIHTCINGQIIPVETVPEMRGGGIKENDRKGEFKCDIFDIL
jgi:uncharacterized protein (DUF433 family)